jgi:hypothetical protein
MQVWGRTTELLSGPTKRPSERWAICPKRAFAPIISQELFVRAQQKSANYTCRLSDEHILERLRQVLKAHGRLTTKLIGQSRLCPSATTFHHRFGGILNVYARLGYDSPEQPNIANRTRTAMIRRELIKTLLVQFPDRLEEIRLSGRFRSRLRDIETESVICTIIARFYPTAKGEARWLLDRGDIYGQECNRVTIIALLDERNAAVQELKVFPKVDLPRRRVYVRQGNKWLQSGTPLERVSDFFDILHRNKWVPVT